MEAKATASETIASATREEMDAVQELKQALIAAAAAAAISAKAKSDAQLQAAYAGADVMKREAELMKSQLESRFD